MHEHMHACIHANMHAYCIHVTSFQQSHTIAPPEKVSGLIQASQFLLEKKGFAKKYNTLGRFLEVLQLAAPLFTI